MSRVPSFPRGVLPLWIPNVGVFTSSIRMDTMLQLFQEFVTPQQKKLAAMVQTMGGDSVLENEQAMKELVAVESALISGGQHARSRSFDFTELREEVKNDPDEAIEKNAGFFDRKFDIQKRQIVEDIARAVNREGDRIIAAVTAGPHDRIVDPVWRDVSCLYTSRTSFVAFRMSITSGKKW